ncbi:hypothetical protein [Actinacidiphila glaucinigra]|uniref:hypothetical protein n=1 Tax=Actinacidiphila glaucinigra TaxID=235986 RepID=UPI003D8DE60A
MTRTPRTPRPRRLLVLAASAALAAGGALIPTTAFAAPASPPASAPVRAGAANGYVTDDYCYAGEDAYYVYYDYCDVYRG